MVRLACQQGRGERRWLSPNARFMVQPPQLVSSRNLLLGALRPEDLDLLRPHLEAVSLPAGQVVLEPGKPIEHVVFLESGLSSDVAMAGEDRPVECGMVGRDGLVGAPVILGTDRGPHSSFMQVGGHGLRIARDELWRAMEQSVSLRRVLLNFIHVFMAHTAQSAACNARHTLDQRLARWLLLAHDRMEDDRIPLTHEYLSLMLGVRRSGVTVALGAAEAAGTIRRNRGVITVADREKLERSACPCYGIVRAESERVFGTSPRSGPPEG